MPTARRPRPQATPASKTTSRQDEYAALFIERFGEAAWAAERAHQAEEAALYAGCKVQAFLDDPRTEQYGAHDLASLIRCDCAGCVRDRRRPHPF